MCQRLCRAGVVSGGPQSGPEPVSDRLAALTNDDDPEIRGDATAALRPVVPRYPSGAVRDPTDSCGRSGRSSLADPEVTVRAAALDCFGRTVGWPEAAASDALAAVVETAAGDGQYPDPVRERAANQLRDVAVGTPVVTAEMAGDLATLPGAPLVAGQVRRALTTLVRERPAAVSGHPERPLPADVASTPFEPPEHVGETDPDAVLGVRERPLAGLTASRTSDRRHAVDAVVVARQRPDESPDRVTAPAEASVDYDDDYEWPIAPVATEYPDAATDLAKAVARSVLASGRSRDAASLALAPGDEPAVLAEAMAPSVEHWKSNDPPRRPPKHSRTCSGRRRPPSVPCRSIERRGGLEALDHVEDDALAALAERLPREPPGGDSSTDQARVEHRYRSGYRTETPTAWLA